LAPADRQKALLRARVASLSNHAGPSGTPVPSAGKTRYGGAAMPKPAPRDNRTALPFVLPFLAVYGLLFIYPTLQMIWMSFTDSQLIVPGHWVGLDNYARLLRDWRFGRAVFNTTYFVLMTAVPSTVVGLAIGLVLVRLRGPLQALVLALFFLPYVLPVSTVTTIWGWMLGYPHGVLQGPITLITGEPVHVFRTPSWVLPTVAVMTVWWTSGFNVLLFFAGLRSIPGELYEAARLDGASRWAQFRMITLPLVWPVTALVLTIQVILQMKLFDQLYMFVGGGQVAATLVLVQYIYSLGFQKDQGGYAATVALALFVLVVAFSVLQFTALRARGRR
jgi:multiple sugar transport system permease protein